MLQIGKIVSLAVCVVWINSMSLTTSHAETVLDKKLVEAFVGNCIQNLPQLEKIRAAARVFGWSALSADQLMAMGPQNPSTKFEGWYVKDDTASYLLGISSGNVNSINAVTCTIASPDLTPASFIPALHKLIGLKALDDQSEGGQRYRAWTTTANQNSIMVNLTSFPSDDQVGGSVSAVLEIK